jgi:hypothetical protein
MLKFLKRTAAAGSVALVLGLTASIAFGDGTADTKLQELTVELKKLEVADKDNVATQERGKAEALRDKARSLIGVKKGAQDLQWTLDELDAVVSLVDAKISKHEAEQALAAVQKQVDETRTQTRELTANAATLEKKQSELEKKLGGGK